ESDEQAWKRCFRCGFDILWFGNKVGEGQFRGKAVPTYVYPECIKSSISAMIS
ncbi:unnamed protein product, partial [Porites evermanni]